MKRRLRAGFTLVELLVVLAIIGLLAAIILPAVQHSREAARKTTCRNNLRQIGIALASFESSHGSLPPGRDSENNWNHSWVTLILPHLEQASLYRQYDFGCAWNDPANRTVVETDLATFRCPSAVRDWPGKTDYGGNLGSTLTGLEPGFSNGRGWEAGLLLALHIPFDGFRQSPVRLAEVTDGTSHTFLVLEDADRIADDGGLWANGNNCFSHDLGPINNNPAKEIYSLHPGGANTLLADGHVRFYSTGTDLFLLGALCTRAGEEVLRD